jgi:uncharacterized protein (TIGR03435 family)
MMRRIALVAFAAALVSASPARQLAQSPHFEVVSIKVSKTGDTAPRFRPSPSGRFEWQSVALEPLISVAHQTFAFDEVEIVGLPEWARKERFDIVAQTGTGTPPINANGFPAELAAMIRNMLAERFRLAAHRERRERSAFVLQTARPGQLGPQLKQVDGDCGAALASLTGGRPATPRPDRGPDCSFGGGPGRMQGNAISLEMFSRVLGRLLSRPVVDQTGLMGSFDLDLRYQPDMAGPAAASGPPVDPDIPSIFTAIQEQLGLRVVSGRASVDVLIVDALERPTPD